MPRKKISPPAEDDDYYSLAAGALSQATATTIPTTTSTTNRNRALDTDLYGGWKVSYSNRYDRLEQLLKLHSRVGLGLMKFGLRIARGYNLYVDPEAGVDESTQKEILEECKGLDKRVNGDKWYAIAGTLLARDGTAALLTTEGDDDKSGEYLGLKTIESLPMKRTTLLTSNVEVGMGIKDSAEREKMNTIMGPVVKVVLNESQDEPIRQVYERERVALVRFFPELDGSPDIYGRPTLGVYGISLLDLLDTGGTIKNYMDTLWGFARALGKHGYGRTIFNDTILEWEIKEGKRTRKSAQKILNAEKEAYKAMGPEENIVGAGIQKDSLVPTISSDGGVLAMKESYERDISYAFLETEASSNKAAGSTYASAYVASEDVISVLESIRLQIKRAFESDIYGRHLELLGYDEEECNAIRIELDPLGEPSYTLDQLTNLQTLYPEAFSVEQLFELARIRLPRVDSKTPVAPDQQQQQQDGQQVPPGGNDKNKIGEDNNGRR